ncbi:MerR family transcriptional regulator [Legionella worsleiensis]|uniref:Mercury resistance transcriptional regulator SkgA n=1 Tax=Legionella worsleiensis TaxID=45076 RepID=A0A0W1AJT8_9GAMM|nr:MerR family transcriptional regulator [Legionella worsleiensis]KTD81520.1 mercury resistance transcriptional regulator SkgA [Legionella worsleiensis]STY32079.1 transcriptional regulator SkgA, mercury resistanc [Legionella worsleiensis]
MSYTVNKLARISGVSARTLRFYDEIGLLKPAFYGDNQYRYYKEEQLLMLQQILFFRELGFPLSDIQQILSTNDFDKIESLKAHKSRLQSDIDRTKTLLKTIDKTIKYLKGETKMKNAELYYGFDSEKQKEHEKYLVKEGIVTQEFLNKCNENVKNWSNKEKNAFIQDIERIMDEVIAAIEKEAAPSDRSVQALMKQHYVWLERTWTPSHASYLGLTELYQTPEFRKFYDTRHPKLLEFMVEAMKIFAEHELS